MDIGGKNGPCLAELAKSGANPDKLGEIIPNGLLFSFICGMIFRR